jgi:hypothetical protein
MSHNITESTRKFTQPLLAARMPAEAIAQAWFAASAEDRIAFVRSVGTEAIWAALTAALD